MHSPTRISARTEFAPGRDWPYDRMFRVELAPFTKFKRSLSKIPYEPLAYSILCQIKCW